MRGTQMKKLTNWIKVHQLISFFVFAFLITWGLGYSYWAVMKEGQFLMAPLVFSATCGPALAGLLIKAMTCSHPPSGNRWIAWAVFLSVWIFVTILFLAHFAFINGAPLSPMMIGVVIISVVPVAFITSVTYTRFPLVRRLQPSLSGTRSALWWILIALILIPSLSLISVAVSPLLGRSAISFSNFPATGITLIGWIALKFLYQFFFFNGTGEEVGWRGFALPRIQVRVSPLIASLVLSLFWVPWHLFLWLAEGQPIQTWSYWGLSYMIHIPAGVIVCWLYNRSQGSVLVAGIAHAAANTALALFRNLDSTVLALPLYAFVVVIIFVDHMWRKLPNDHPAVYQEIVPSMLTDHRQVAT